MRRPIWYPRIEQGNPSRSPDWRWQRALCLVAAGKSASAKRDDEPTCRAVGFIRDVERAATERSARRVTRRYPDIALARKLHDGDPLIRLEVECRVLARQSAARIADVMQIPRHIVAAFKDLFFAIDDRINATIYIQYQIIGAVPGADVPPETWMRWQAYRHGPAVIDPWFDYLAHCDEQHDLSTELGWRRDSISLYLAAQNLAINAESIDAFRKNLANLFGLNANTRIHRSPAAVIEDEMIRTMHKLPFSEPAKPSASEPESRAYGRTRLYSQNRDRQRKVS